MELTLGYSPCPNDCFIFDALVHKKIDTQGLTFNVTLADVETLNTMALQGSLDVSKLSFHAYAYARDIYILLRAGSALGFNCGPLVVKRKGNIFFEKKTPAQWKVAIPGKLTTANFLLSVAYPEIKNKVEYLFSEIEDKVIDGTVDAGLIIHENRFTYAGRGLEKIMDLGEYWDSLIHAPIPLGGIAIKRTLPHAIQQQVNNLIAESVRYAFSNPQSAMPYVKTHASEMSEEVMKQHINLYVNNFSVDLGETGKNAIRLMYDKAAALSIFGRSNQNLIID